MNSVQPIPCPLCGYDLRGLPGGRTVVCPECGRIVERVQPPPPARAFPMHWLLGIIATPLLMCIVANLLPELRRGLLQDLSNTGFLLLIAPGTAWDFFCLRMCPPPRQAPQAWRRAASILSDLCAALALSLTSLLVLLILAALGSLF